MPKITQLSRKELMTLLYDKLETIREEASELMDPDAEVPADLSHAMMRLKRIAIEAKRAASLIDTYEVCSRAGHCSFCGKTYEEHLDQRPPGERVRLKHPPDEPRCVMLKRFFDSLEVETYQGVQIVEAS